MADVNVNVKYALAIGPRLVRVDGKVLGTIERINIDVDKGNIQEINTMMTADVIELVRPEKEGA